MKKIFALLLVLALALTATAAMAENSLEEILNKGQIVFTTSPDFPPSEFIDPNQSGDAQYVGADVELAKYIAEQLGVELVIEPMDFDSTLAAVGMDKVDIAISGFSYTDERAEKFALTDSFNLDDTQGQGLLVLAGTADKFNEVADFDGLIVGAQSGSLQYNLVTTQLTNAKVEIITDLKLAVMQLATGKIDALAIDNATGDMFSTQNEQVEMCNFYFEFEGEGNVALITKGEDELQAKVNEIIADVNEKGLYMTWKEEAIELAISLGQMDE